MAFVLFLGIYYHVRLELAYNDGSMVSEERSINEIKTNIYPEKIFTYKWHYNNFAWKSINTIKLGIKNTVITDISLTCFYQIIFAPLCVCVYFFLPMHTHTHSEINLILYHIDNSLNVVSNEHRDLQYYAPTTKVWWWEFYAWLFVCFLQSNIN